jgi:hypothetical protein
MPKQHWEDEIIEPNPDAHQVVTQGTKEGGKEPAKEPSKEASHLSSIQGNLPGVQEESKETSKEGRRRAWHQPGQEEWKKTNYEMPLRVQTKLKEMKNWGYIPNVYRFVAEVVEMEIDKVIAKAEQEGY